ncbi:MAG: hypothetical protein A2660_02225 [Candidatus Doudnabacteria bacterium RIFCSPHIGHO2_01_FULL_45_18]|uniref:Uncharacterized protein n=1 Tax=Candidatus Doudnabacteria bacterium RIFCSPHIGHO2_01_FULL_45_18 TaxID=1817823 RepID=A0A1F5NRL9_9BACT|nr:MAG: hypothetical protein A2660_02225 [Candidatus Doudnabacteria bacterium RIFCSPHIGHO2_01_FULL_45_18]
MSELAELLSVDDKRALEFFAQRLSDVSGPQVDRMQLIYNASVLAHYAQVSTSAEAEFPAPATLSAVFDHFVTDTTLLSDRSMMETAGAQCLVLSGFFQDQMRRRHNIDWYARLGAGFFIRSAYFEPSQAKAKLLYKISKNFEPWRQRHALLSRELRDTPYLLKPPS